MPSNPIILLDTPVVAGSFAVSKKGGHVEAEKILWRKIVRTLASKVSPKNMIRVPTPVCYELMAMNKECHEFIKKSPYSTFRFAHNSIPNDILMLAAEYSYSTTCVYYDGEQQKIKSMDPLIAAYCIKGEHHLLTTNQHDFPESHFSVVDTEVVILSEKKQTQKYYLLIKTKKIIFLICYN